MQGFFRVERQNEGEAKEAARTDADPTPPDTLEAEAALMRARLAYEEAWREFQAVLKTGTATSPPDPAALVDAQDRLMSAGKTLREMQRQSRRR